MNIDNLLQIIDQSNAWVASALKAEKQSNARKRLLNYKRQLNKKKFALAGNPAAAIYGESQMGKSYLVSSLLSEPERPFRIIDGKGEKYDFINQINPIGGRSEATSLVTRFSTAYEFKNPDFPVQAKLLSPADIILVLCDSYYNDVKAKIDFTLREDDINRTIIELSKNKENQQTRQGLLKEEDILDISDYFSENFSTKSTNVIHSKFFEITAANIDKFKPEEWHEVFELLWNKNPDISKIFSDLVKYYAKLDFSEIIYLPINAVLRDYGTLLDVERLYEISKSKENIDNKFIATTPILLINGQNERIISDFSKSFLCALSAELIFQVPKELETSKAFLKHTDLLDFPGARHRLGINEEDIGVNVIPQMLLRGKVAYLFKKYSKAEKINILLFCHNNQQSAQSVMPELLKSWIDEMIGNSPQVRQTFISKSKIPPLFVISTMFNIDLEYDLNNDNRANRSYRDNRWFRRFDRVLKMEIFGSENEQYKWVENWTLDSSTFKNIYLLRDFYYSSEVKSKVYTGYNEYKRELSEVTHSNYPEFLTDLKESFVEYPFVKNHFEDPGFAWNSTVSINEDGSKWIIDRLAISAANINNARFEKNAGEFLEIKNGVIQELKKYYHDSESDGRLRKAKSTAGQLQYSLDSAFGNNPYFFGPMMRSLMISKNRVYEFFMNKIRDVERRDIYNLDKYTAIRMNVSRLSPNEDFDTNLEYLRIHYEMASKEECKLHFESEEIDLNELFYGQVQRVKNFAQVFSEELEVHFFVQYLEEKREEFIAVFGDDGFQDLLDMLRTLFKKLHISSRIIAPKIRHYAEEYRNSERTYEMIADMSSEVINKFLDTVGFEYFSEQDISELKDANEKNGLGLIFDHEQLDYATNNHPEAAMLITKMSNLANSLNQNPLPQDVKRLPIIKNYMSWYNLLKVGFISVCDIPNYDVQANELLKSILNECESIEH